MKHILTILLLSIIFFSSCGQSNTKPKNDAANANDNAKTTTDKEIKQSYFLDVDGKRYDIQEGEISIAAYSDKKLLITVLSQKKDLQFILSVYMDELKPGTYQVYDCDGGPSACDGSTQQKGQTASLSDFPKDPPSDPDLFKGAYNGLGLTPLEFTLISVVDDGMRFQSKRIEGKFSGSLARVKLKDQTNWEIVGKQVKVEGKFDLYCAIK